MKELEIQKAKLRELENLNLAPWENLPTQDLKVVENVTLQILDIPKHARNILDVPPNVEIVFPFDISFYILSAKQALDKDPQLSKLYYTVVPNNLSEVQFWRNYFYRVFLIKSSFGLPSPLPIPEDVYATEEQRAAPLVAPEGRSSSASTDSPSPRPPQGASTQGEETAMAMVTPIPTVVPNTTESAPPETREPAKEAESSPTPIQKPYEGVLEDGVDVLEEKLDHPKDDLEFASDLYNDFEDFGDWKENLKNTLTIPDIDSASDEDLDISEILSRKPMLMND
uniref:BSD domain-containing protein n=1 Tax=Arcella intermedia TaxID=1963864 RepID=A0A6B2LA60_9EUKA